MGINVLWPRSRPGDHAPELEGAGDGIDAVFCSSIDEVSDEQWATAEGIVGPAVAAEHLPKLEKCRILVKSAVGFDDVDLEAFGKAGIAVCNTPDYGTREVADHAIALMMTLVKSIAFHDEALREDPVGNWRPALNPYGRRLSACTFGVIGLGRIGTAAMRRAKAFDMDCVFYDPYKPNGVELSLGVRRADSLEELLGQCDIVSIHTPLNDETRDMINSATLAAAKKGIIIINSARGPIIDIDALHDALKNDTVLAAGLDVLPDEPANMNKPLISAWHNNEDWIKHRLVVTPHSAFFTPESVHDIRAFSARTAARYLRDGRLENLVNGDFLENPR